METKTEGIDAGIRAGNDREGQEDGLWCLSMDAEDEENKHRKPKKKKG